MQEPTQREVELVEELRKAVRELSLPKFEIDTKNLIRYIRARNHSVKNAEVMLRRQVAWREDNDIDHILNCPPPSEFGTYWPWRVTGFDDQDNPVIIIPLGVWDPSKVTGNYQEFVRYCFYNMELVWTLIRHKSKDKKTMRQFCAIVDLKGLCFRTVTSLDAMHGFLEAIKAFEGGYPETLRVGFLLNAPYVFEIGWRLIKPFLSEETHSKLQFLGSDSSRWKDSIEKYMGTDQFPAVYGGDLPDTAEVTLEKEYGKKGSNCNDYICDNLMQST